MLPSQNLCQQVQELSTGQVILTLLDKGGRTCLVTFLQVIKQLLGLVFKVQGWNICGDMRCRKATRKARLTCILLASGW